MMQCRCGGLISQAELTSGRERGHCLSCGAYEIFERQRRLDLTPSGQYDLPVEPRRLGHDRARVSRATGPAAS